MPKYKMASEVWLEYLRRVNLSPNEACIDLYSRRNHENLPIQVMMQEVGFTKQSGLDYLKRQMEIAGFKFERVGQRRREFIRIEGA